MIYGIVTTSFEPVVPLHVRGPSGQSVSVDVVVDIGFTGLLVLPDTIVAALGLPWKMNATAVLADGSTQATDYFDAEIDWGGIWVSVSAMSIGPEALLGMKMLYGHRLTVEGGPGGLVEIVPWP